MSENFTTEVSEVTDDLAGRFLTFYVGPIIYGMELLHVIEIISIQNITHVPNVPPHIKGIINLRGKIVPVINVRTKFGVQEQPYDDKTCIIVVVIDEMHVGLIVDSVAEVVTATNQNLSAPPEMGGTNQNRYLRSVARIGDRVVLNIDCAKFFHSDLFNL